MHGPLVAITGASSGIGLAVARAFAAEGHALLLIARHIGPEPGLEERPVLYAQADVADYDAVAAAVAAAERRFGGVDCLVQSAGVADARPFDEVEPPSYRREVETNLLGVLNGIKSVLGGMAQRRRGTIINISSISDRKTGPTAIAYTATRFAVRGLTESLREAQASGGVRVINIAPGYVKTNIQSGMGITFEEYRRLLGDPDFMTAEELAGVIQYCYRLPAHLCVRELVIAPTRTTF